MTVTLYHGECVAAMASMEQSSVDAIVTDPPYGLGFLGNAWDRKPPGVDWAEACARVLKPGGFLLAFGATRTWHHVAVALEQADFEIIDTIAWLHSQGMPKGETTLKPGFEPITVARNAGAKLPFQVDACRLEVDPEERFGGGAKGSSGFAQGYTKGDGFVTSGKGRYPPNVTMDEVVAADLGNKARYFYTAKPNKFERVTVDGVTHPTQKPLALMQWLVRLVVAPGQVVLDTFAGSGTTLVAAVEEGLDCIGIEREADYIKIAQSRIDCTVIEVPEPEPVPVQPEPDGIVVTQQVTTTPVQAGQLLYFE